jgi:hypothetical protein
MAGAGDTTVETALRRRVRRQGPALGAALLVNLALIAAIVAAERPQLFQQRPDAISVTFIDYPIKSTHRSHVTTEPTSKPERERGPPTPPPPFAPRLPAPPPAAAPAAPVSPIDKRWATPPTSAKTLEDAPSPWRSMRMRDHCASAEFWKMPTEDQDRCRTAWARYKPDAADGPMGFHRGPPLKDPHGDWGRAAAEQEDRRKPMASAPVHPCPLGTPGGNLGVVCH